MGRHKVKPPSISFSKLAWPKGIAKTETREWSTFWILMPGCWRDFVRQLKKMQACNVEICWNLTCEVLDEAILVDGDPEETDGIDTSVVIHFDWQTNRYRVVCGRWKTFAENLRGCYYTLRGMHDFRISGAESVSDPIFQSCFIDKLRTPIPKKTVSWRKILGTKRFPNANEIRMAWKEKAKMHHPDNGGNEDDMKRINAAKDEAMKYLREKKGKAKETVAW